MIIRAYMRASTVKQDASRARAALEAFVEERGVSITACYTENISGASLHRPKLFELLADSKPGDVLLIEQVDRLSRLNDEDWRTLKGLIAEKKVNIVSLDLPTSWSVIEEAAKEATKGTTALIMAAVNAMLLDIIAVTSRKDYEDRRRRAAEGVVKAQAQGKYAGRPEDTTRLELISTLLQAGKSYGDIQAMTAASRATIAKVSKRLKEAEAACS